MQDNHSDPEVFFAPELKGTLSPQDLLRSEGSCVFSFYAPDEWPEGSFVNVIFSIKTEGFVFSLSLQNNMWVLERNEIINILTLEDLDQKNEIKVIASWSYSQLTLAAGKSGQPKKTSKVPTKPILPPVNLVQWFRKHNLIPNKKFSDLSEFRQQVHAAFVTIPQKIRENDAYKTFWNIEYEGKKIKERKPKSETELQPFISCMISDPMLAAGIEVISEAHTGAGNVDFLLTGVVNGKIQKVCVEVKLAHSTSLEDGYFIQLPEYMRHHNAAFGIYYILNFKGDWFNKPQFDITDQASFYLSLCERERDLPERDSIRIFELMLAKPPTASKRKE